MIDAREKLPHVAGQHVTVLAGERLAAIQRPMRALADPVGVAVSDEAALESRLDDVAQRMMHHPVAERRSRNQALLGSWMWKLA